jgi:uncharacterized protein YggE
MSPKKLLVIASLALAAQAQAQSVPTTGTLIVIPATGEVTRANDQATASLSVEEQDKDKAAAASRVNAKMREGTELLKKLDPQAKFKTHGYYTYPVYPEDRPLPPGAVAKPRQPTAWRVGQYLEYKTTNIANLQKTIASVQRILSLNGLQFGLSPEAAKATDAARIAAAYRNLNERIAAIAEAMGRKPSEAVLEMVDFEGSGNYGGQQAEMRPAPMMAKVARDTGQVEEPSFEPGETTLEMRLVGKVKFK